MILKKDYLNYEDALKLTNLQSLDERRTTLAMRFAKNCLKNGNYSKLFPLNNPKHGMKVRDPLKYQIKRANTERYKGSSIIYMQKLLNDDYRRRKKEMKEFNNELNNSQVNYVI